MYEVKPFVATIIDGCDGPVVDISLATEMKMRFQKPASAGGTAFERDCLHVSDGTDGKIYYKTVSTDLDAKGTWKRQCRVVTPNGEYFSDIQSFVVYKNIEV